MSNVSESFKCCHLKHYLDPLVQILMSILTTQLYSFEFWVISFRKLNVFIFINFSYKKNVMHSFLRINAGKHYSKITE